MLNYSHSLGGLGGVLLLLNFGVGTNSSIWAILLSILLSQLMNADTSKSSISKVFGFKTISNIIQNSVSGPKRESHSIFFGVLLTLLLTPVSIYLSIIDQSSIFDNSLVFFVSIMSHLLLDLYSSSGIPLFFFPKLNPITSCGFYSYGNFLSQIVLNLGNSLLLLAKKFKSPTLSRIGNGFKSNYGKYTFKIGVNTSSELEFKQITVPLLVITLILFISNWHLLFVKMSDSQNLITHSVLLGIILFIYSLNKNYVFSVQGGLLDFISGGISNGFNQVNWSELKKILGEETLIKLLIFVMFLISAFYNSTTYIDNYGHSIEHIYYIFQDLFTSDENIFTRLYVFILDVLKYFLF